MSRRSTSWLGGLLGGSEQQDVDRFSIEHLRHLRDVLIHNPIVNDANRDAVVEALRSIAELMVWGDQHDPKFLEYFLENNILQHFTNILHQRSNRRGEVAIQVLQTLSMLIQVDLGCLLLRCRAKRGWSQGLPEANGCMTCAEHTEQNCYLLYVQQQPHQ